MKFRVWGLVDGKQFDQLFDSIDQWRQEKRLVARCGTLEVLGMASV